MMYTLVPIIGLDQPIEYTQLEYNGIDILAYKSEEGYILERIYSTDPRDFLKPEFQPGTLLENSLIKLV